MVEDLVRGIFVLFVGIGILAVFFAALNEGNVQQATLFAQNFIVYGFLLAVVVAIAGAVLAAAQ